ncbi:MAG: amidohydrolase family protein, partial [bacterium]
HASMGCVAGSLEGVAAAYAATGVRGTLCFETSERAGLDAVGAHLRENIDFFEHHRGDPMMQGFLGLHANLTLSNETLERISRERPADMPVHVHCGEAPEDVDRCRREGFEGPVDRLHRFDLLEPATILAHCIHLSERDHALLDEIGPVVVTNPESNANNAVGHLNPNRRPDFLFGTDGMTGDPIGAGRFHFLALRDRGAGMEAVERALFRNAHALLARTFAGRAGTARVEEPAGGGAERRALGALTPGAPADIAVLDYVPAAPIDAGNIVPHLIYGAGSGRAFMTICNGRVLFENGRVTFLDEEQFNRAARRVASALHRRFYEGRHHG